MLLDQFVLAFGLVAPVFDVEVGQEAVDEPQEDAAAEEADRRREPFDEPHGLGQLDRRREQGPEARGDHHARRESKHAVENPPVDALEEEDHSGAQGRHPPGEEGREERLDDRGHGREPLCHADSIHWPRGRLQMPRMSILKVFIDRRADRTLH